MIGLRTAHAIATLLIGVAIALLCCGWIRIPVAILSFACLALVASAERLRVSAATLAWKNKP